MQYQVCTYYSVQTLDRFSQSERLYTTAYGFAMLTFFFVEAFLTVLSMRLYNASFLIPYTRSTVKIGALKNARYTPYEAILTAADTMLHLTKGAMIG